MNKFLKNKKIGIIISIIGLILITIGIVIFIKKDNEVIISDEERELIIDIKNGEKAYSLEKVDIIDTSLVCKEESCNIILKIYNPLPDNVDLAKDYKIYVYGNDDSDILAIIDGIALGKVKANDTIICDMKIMYNENQIGKIGIRKVN